MIRIIHVFTFVMLLTVIFSCHRKTTTMPEEETTELAKPSPEDQLHQLAREAYQRDYEIIYNQPKTVAMVRKMIKPSSKSIYYTAYFFLYDLESEMILHKDVVLNVEQVKWISPNEISVTSVPSQVQDPEADAGPGYIYHVKNRTKRKLG